MPQCHRVTVQDDCNNDLTVTCRCRETVFAVVIDFFNGAGQLLLSASSSDAYNQFMVMQIEMWRSGAAAQADQIISRCMMWLVQMYQEPGLLEGAETYGCSLLR